MSHLNCCNTLFTYLSKSFWFGLPQVQNSGASLLIKNTSASFAKTDLSIFIYSSLMILFVCTPGNVNQTGVGLFILRITFVCFCKELFTFSTFGTFRIDFTILLSTYK